MGQSWQGRLFTHSLSSSQSWGNPSLKMSIREGVHPRCRASLETRRRTRKDSRQRIRTNIVSIRRIVGWWKQRATGSSSKSPMSMSSVMQRVVWGKVDNMEWISSQRSCGTQNDNEDRWMARRKARRWEQFWSSKPPLGSLTAGSSRSDTRF